MRSKPPAVVLLLSLRQSAVSGQQVREAASSVDLTVGCWTVHAGEFKGSQVDSGMTALPLMIRFDTVPGTDFLGQPEGLRVRSVPVRLAAPHQVGSYRMWGRDTVLLAWSSGFTGLGIRAAVSEAELKGEAELWTDYGGTQRAPIALRRAECPVQPNTPMQPTSAPMLRLGRERAHGSLANR